MSESGAFGIHDSAYHVGRVELLGWLNGLLGTNIAKIEQCANGAPYCQIFDALFGDVPMKKVNIAAKLEHDYVKNYKVLQTVFEKKGVDKPIPVERLIKGRYQDNLEFLQWCKRYYDIHSSGAPPQRVPPPSQAPAGAAAAETKAPTSARKRPVTNASPQPSQPTTTTTAASATSGGGGAITKPTGAHNPPPRRASDSERGKMLEMEQANHELELTVAYLEKERDFYYHKLRDIEILCQTQQSKDPDFVQKVTNILWKEDDEGASDVNKQTTPAGLVPTIAEDDSINSPVPLAPALTA